MIALAIYGGLRARTSKRASAIRADNEEAGLTEPPSLHPEIDLMLCCGSGACVTACPEHDVIGIVKGKAQLIDPTACVGHGACAAACPTQAISLVFGTATRGIELPHVTPSFETNVPGIFIAGELGGMGLIRNAIEQGRQAMESIAKLPGLGRADRLDVIIVGAGPAGFAASLGAKEAKLNFRTIEQEKFGGTVAHFPRGKLVMTKPAMLPIIGQMKFGEVQKETLMAFWNDAIKKADLTIHHEERLEKVTPDGDGFEVTTSVGTYKTRAVLLSIGRRGTPRSLGVPGEHLPKVVYRLDDPAQYRGKSVIVVGGGDSALEAAAVISEEPDTKVILSYRGDAFQRARRKNRSRVDAAMSDGRLKVHFKSEVKEVLPEQVKMKTQEGMIDIPNDAIIVCAGGVLPGPFLKSLGVELVMKRGEA